MLAKKASKSKERKSVLHQVPSIPSNVAELSNASYNKAQTTESGTKSEKGRKGRKLISEKHSQQMDDKHVKREMMILESQEMSNDVKNWWNTTLNDLNGSSLET